MKQISWRIVIAEFAGCIMLEFLSGGAVIASATSGNLVTAALGMGLSLAVITFLTLGVSGAHLNPAVTLAVAVTGQGGQDFGPLEAGAYCASQFLGAICGAVLLRASVPLEYGCEVSENQPSCQGVHILTFLVRGSLSAEHGVAVFVFEFICTFALVWVYFATIIDARSFAQNLAPIAVGMAMFVGVLTEGPWTGAALSPARVVGPAVAFGAYSHCVAPIAGAFLGGAAAGLVYCYFFLFGQDVPDVYKITCAPGEHEAKAYMEMIAKDTNSSESVIGEGGKGGDAKHTDVIRGYQERWLRHSSA